MLPIEYPNEDFETSKNIRSTHFVSTFHTPNYSIWAKSDEKSLQNVLTECPFDVSNSSFGEHTLSALGRHGMKQVDKNNR